MHKNHIHKTAVKLVLISVGLLFNGAHVISIALAEIKGYFSAYDTSQIQLLVTAPSVSSFIALLLSASIAHKFGRRATLLCAIALFGISGILPFFIRLYPVILTTRLLMGFSLGIMNPVSTAILSTLFSGNELAGIMGFAGSAVSLGQIGMTAVASALVLHGWYYCFLIYFVAFIIFTIAAIFLPALPRSPAQKNPSQNKLQDIPKTVWILFALTVFYFAFQMNVYTNLSIMVSQDNIGNPAELGIAVTMMNVTSMLVGLGFGYLHRKVKSWLYVLTFMIVGIGSVVLFRATTMTAVFMALIIMGAGFALSMPFFLTVATGIASAKSSDTPITIVIAASSVGSFLSPYVMIAIQKLSGRPDARYSFLFSAIAFLTVAIGLSCAKRVRSAQKDNFPT